MNTKNNLFTEQNLSRNVSTPIPTPPQEPSSRAEANSPAVDENVDPSDSDARGPMKRSMEVLVQSEDEGKETLHSGGSRRAPKRQKLSDVTSAAADRDASRTRQPHEAHEGGDSHSSSARGRQETHESWSDGDDSHSSSSRRQQEARGSWSDGGDSQSRSSRGRQEAHGSQHEGGDSHSRRSRRRHKTHRSQHEGGDSHSSSSRRRHKTHKSRHERDDSHSRRSRRRHKTHKSRHEGGYSHSHTGPRVAAVPGAPADQAPVSRVPREERLPVAKEAHNQEEVDKTYERLQAIEIEKRALEEKVTAMSTWQYISLGGLVVDSKEMHTSHGLTVSGSYGSTVHKAKHFDQKVAVKKVPKKSKCRDIRVFLNNRISQHKHLLSSSLMTEDKDFYYIVTDRCVCSLDEFIHNAETRDKIDLPESTMAKEIALGLAHLHSEDMMHRGLHPRNVLIQRKNGILKTVLSDFGQSRAVETPTGHGYRNSYEIVQNGYMSPSALGVRRRYTEMDDMFSFGVVAHELASLLHPFDDNALTTREQRYENMREFKVTIFGKKPGENPSEERTAGHNDTVKENEDHLLLAFVIRWLLEEDEEKRPTARQLEMGPFLMDEERRFKFVAKSYDYFKGKENGRAVEFFNEFIPTTVIKPDRRGTRNWYDQLSAPHRRFLEAEKHKAGRAYWPYEVESVGHLLRAVRNSEAHQTDVTALHMRHPNYDAKEIYRAFEEVAPGLLPHIYYQVSLDPDCERVLTGYS